MFTFRYFHIFWFLEIEVFHLIFILKKAISNFRNLIQFISFTLKKGQPLKYEAESTLKIELLLRRIECRVAESVFVSSNHTSLNGIKTRAAESNFIHFRFVSLNLVSLGRYVLVSTNFVLANWKFSFFLPFWSCFFLIFVAFSHVFLSRFTILKNKMSLGSQLQS